MFLFLQKLWVSVLMNPVFCRIFQFFFNIVVTFLYFPTPQITEGEGCLNKGVVADILKKRKISSVILVTDKGLTSLHMTDSVTQSLTDNGIKFVLYDNTVANPTIDNVEEALKLYHENGCQAIIGFGGGSPLDCAKGVGARVARPGKSITKMRGILKVLWPTPPIIAIPTTAGTGSEITVAAILTDSKTHEKFAVTDVFLTPRYVILDPLLTVKCPPHITSTCGMDALTHAIESYLNAYNTKDTRQKEVEATELIFTYIRKAYDNGTDIEARSRMLHASFLAGYAFTRKFVGNVHAIAHQLGGMYGIPHGYANAVLLPWVLEAYGKNAHKKLAELCAVVKLKVDGDTDAEAARRFIEAIRNLNRAMDIPTKLKGIKDEDIPLLAVRAGQEANPYYPVPRVFSLADFENVLKIVKED